ncbi:MAG: hypothetical protein AD073_000295 [Mycoplasmataceae bacterium]|nr:MAG: hypothetical protein AD073_000295 [Mycoplasmataceae bacterium]
MESTQSKFPKQGETWLIDYTFNFSKFKDSEFEIENQIKKLRPSIILSNNIQNEFNNRLIVAPLTSKSIDIVNHPFEILIKKDKENGLEKDSKILLNFLVSLDKEYRLNKYLGKVNKTEISKVLNGVNILFKSF